MEEAGEGIALDDDDVDSVDQDADSTKESSSRQQSASFLSLHLPARLILWVDRTRTHTGRHPTRPITSMDRDVNCFVPKTIDVDVDDDLES